MKQSVQVLTVCVVCYGIAGCGSRAADPVGESPGGDNPAEATAVVETDAGSFARLDLDEGHVPAGLTRDTPADQVVAAFLGALRSGDSGIAEALLTRRACEETRKRGLAVRPIGSPDAKFQVGSPSYLGTQRNGAHVNTAWTDTQAGAVVNYDVVWTLRRQESGWRVAGMGAQVEPGQPMVYFDFENPDDMLAKWRSVDDEFVTGQRPDPGVRQARGAAPTGGIQR